ncbi:sensor histidine kinase [Pontibacter beigongshangensis]|uniref:sensor histidine kinase n=1 Tax=Pontibacter beigongshangensis TaxID=2574733 RepID=UPI00165080CE|nr:GAF domain-containing sensor histidine kinase [Pontibacter beigongshangensis]
MIDTQDELYKDFEAVRQIPIVSTMLEVICQTTGMGFAAIARVTQDRWLACSVRDEVQFGLEEGGELKIGTTLCNEIRDHHQPVVIDNVDDDLVYKNHHTPKLYGLQSYISIPIILKDGTFFGTLCAIDSKPAQVNNPKVIGTFKMFAELLSFHLQSLDLLERSHLANVELQSKNRSLVNANFDLDNFVYTASHDLKLPITNIQALIDILSELVTKDPLDKEEIKSIAGLLKSSLLRFKTTVNDLTTIVELEKSHVNEKPETVDIFEIVESAKQDLVNLIEETDAGIKVVSDVKLLTGFSKKNFKSIIYNLLSNALKYRSPDRSPEVIVKVERIYEKTHLSIKDNGLGIPAGKQGSLFTMFQRFHDHVDGSGIGLYIVKRMVDNMKGQIQVSSTLNQGTTFTIIF